MQTISSHGSSMIPIVLLFFCVLVSSALGWRVLKLVWLQPRKLEKQLREQGFRGNPYKFLSGDLKEMSTMLKEAHSKPLNLSDDNVPRILPLVFETVKKYGKNSYFWFGTAPSVLIMDPDLVREVTQNIQVFQKARNNFAKLLSQGLTSFDGDKWAKHRKLLNPAFHMEKLKLMLPAFHESASEMLRKWEDIAASHNGSIEVDVWPDLQTFTGDAISRTAFGSNYEQGKRIFELQTEQLQHVTKAARSSYFPGMRFLPTKRNKLGKKLHA